ncbi:hypothetical protein EDB83DRAFT_2312022 [Lactarius deliciosus]|nr:hypothetical protein EDB83DRAFT_2312022 [Lactarius deliciosus]
MIVDYERGTPKDLWSVAGTEGGLARKSVGLRVVRVESAETSSLIPSTLVKRLTWQWWQSAQQICGSGVGGDGVANVRDGGGEDLVTEEQVANTFSDSRFMISGCGADTRARRRGVNRKNLGKNATLSITPNMKAAGWSIQAREPGYWAVELVATVIATDFANVFAGRSAMDTIDKIFAQAGTSRGHVGVVELHGRFAANDKANEARTEFTCLNRTQSMRPTLFFAQLHGRKYMVNPSDGQAKPAKGHPLGAMGLAMHFTVTSTQIRSLVRYEHQNEHCILFWNRV